MKYKSGFFLISVIIALSAELPDYKPTAPIHEIRSVKLGSDSSANDTYSIERFHYSDDNLVEGIKRYTIDASGEETLSLSTRYTYDGANLDSVINNRGGKTAYLYGDENRYCGYYSYSSPNTGQSGSSTTDKILSYTADGKPLERLIVHRGWGRYTSSTDSLKLTASYDSDGTLVSENGLLQKIESRTGGPTSIKKQLVTLRYSYDGDFLVKKSELRSDDDSVTESSNFYETEYTTYVQLTGLSGEDVSVEEHFQVTGGESTLKQRVTVSRNEQGNVIDSLHEVHVDSLGELVEKSHFAFRYDESGLLDEVSYSQRSGDVLNHFRKEYHYKNGTAISGKTVSAPSEMKVAAKNSTITFNMSSGGAVSLNVYSVDGRKVMTLFDGRNLEEGNYTLDLKPIAQFRGVAAGLYIYQFSALGKQFSGKVAIQ